jgi:hypothetical protein
LEDAGFRYRCVDRTHTTIQHLQMQMRNRAGDNWNAALIARLSTVGDLAIEFGCCGEF